MNYNQPCYPPTSDCITKPKGKCVLYSGVYLPPLNVTAGDTLDSILLKISNLIGGGSTTIETDDSTSIDFSGTGSSISPLTAVVKLDPDPSNTISITAGGLLATGLSVDFIDNYFA